MIPRVLWVVARVLLYSFVCCKFHIFIHYVLLLGVRVFIRSE